MTLTEAREYTEQVYLQEGWITEEQIKVIHHEANILAMGIILAWWVLLCGQCSILLSRLDSGLS